MKEFEEWFAEVRRLALAAGIDDYSVNHAYTWLDDYDDGKTPTEALYAEYPITSPDYNPDLYSNYLITGSRWVHRNGCKYIVEAVTNRHSTDYHRYPPMVVYRGENGHIWSRLAADWDRSMTALPWKWYELGYWVN